MIRWLLLESNKVLFALKLDQKFDFLVEWIEAASVMIELLAVLIIIGSVFYATVRFFYYGLTKKTAASENYHRYKQKLGQWLLLGLEILVAADVVRTIALEPTLENIAGLGLLILVRTFLSWSLVVEIEGRWPWQAKANTPLTIQGESGMDQ